MNAQLLIIPLLQALVLPLISPLFIGVIRKIKARLQNRRGASVIQPYRDIIKLFHKDEVVSHDASWVFMAVPFILFALTLVIGAVVPMFFASPEVPVFGGYLTVVYLLAFSAFFIALAGIDAGSAFGGFGSSREMTVSALAEGGLVFSALPLILMAGTTQLFALPGEILALPTILAVHIPILLAFAAFFIALLAENARFPFDNPSTHLELTMIHEAMILEYSGKRLALVEWAAANKLTIFFMLGANIFFPWGIATNLAPQELLAGMGAFFLKALVFCLMIAVIESAIAKFRFFRLPNLLFSSFVLSIVAISFVIS